MRRDMANYYLDVTSIGDDGDPVRQRIPVTLAVLRAYSEDARRHLRIMHSRGQCSNRVWQRCDGDCHVCSYYVPRDIAWQPEIGDAVRHARDEYGASAEEIVMQRSLIELVFAGLTRMQQDIMLLAAAGLTNSEIAAVLGIPRKRVYRTRLRARDIGDQIIGQN